MSDLRDHVPATLRHERLKAWVAGLISLASIAAITALGGAIRGNMNDVAWETADVFYFAICAMVRAGVKLEDVERVLDLRALKVTRR